MGHLSFLSIAIVIIYLTSVRIEAETVLSSVLTPSTKTKLKSTLPRQARSYNYDPRLQRPYERLQYDQPSRCGRCLEDRYDDRDDYDRPSDRYDSDRRHRPTYGNRYDRNKNYDRDDDYDMRKGDRKNGTSDETEDDKKKYDERDEDRRPVRGKERDRNRYDDRDRYRPDYYDRFLRDPYRERPYDDVYRERRPYERFDDPYSGRLDYGYRRQVYDDRFDRGNGYDDTGYGSYSPTAGKGLHDSFRPWDETYRGQAGWDDGGRGYYFAGGRPEAGAGGWSQGYARPEPSGWQNVGYAGSYRDPQEYPQRGGYASDAIGYRQDAAYRPYVAGYQQEAAGYRPEAVGYRPEGGYRPEAGYRPAGWHSVGDRRPYRDQSGVNQDTRGVYRQGARPDQTTNSGAYGQGNRYGQDSTYGQGNRYGQDSTYGQNSNRGQSNTYSSQTNQPTSSSTTPGNSYLYERDDDGQVTTRDSSDAPTVKSTTS